jgi:hypothetical protein
MSGWIRVLRMAAASRAPDHIGKARQAFAPRSKRSSRRSSTKLEEESNAESASGQGAPAEDEDWRAEKKSFVLGVPRRACCCFDLLQQVDHFINLLSGKANPCHHHHFDVSPTNRFDCAFVELWRYLSEGQHNRSVHMAYAHRTIRVCDLASTRVNEVVFGMDFGSHEGSLSKSFSPPDDYQQLRVKSVSNCSMSFCTGATKPARSNSRASSS